MDSSTQSCDHELGHRDQNGTDALVSDPQDLGCIRSERMGLWTLLYYLLAISDNYIVDFLATSEISHRTFDAVLVPNVQETALRSSE